MPRESCDNILRLVLKELDLYITNRPVAESGHQKWKFKSENWFSEVKILNWGPDYRAEISSRLVKQILLKSNCRLHGEGLSPGRNSARAKNPSPVWKTRLGFSARPNRPENLKNSHVIETEFQPGWKVSLDMRSDFVFQETRWLPLQRRSDFRGIKEIKHSLDIRKFFLQHQSGTSSPIIFCHHWSVRPFITQTDLRFRRTRRAWRFLLFLCKYVFLAERYAAKDRFRFSSIIL